MFFIFCIGGLIRISVQQIWGQRITESLEVDQSDTIGDIKSKLSEKLGIPMDDQILLNNKRLLRDSCTLLYYSITKKDILDLRLQLRGWKHLL